MGINTTQEANQLLRSSDRRSRPARNALVPLIERWEVPILIPLRALEHVHRHLVRVGIGLARGLLQGQGRRRPESRRRSVLPDVLLELLDDRLAQLVVRTARRHRALRPAPRARGPRVGLDVRLHARDQQRRALVSGLDVQGGAAHARLVVVDDVGEGRGDREVVPVLVGWDVIMVWCDVWFVCWRFLDDDVRYGAGGCGVDYGGIQTVVEVC